MPRWVYIVHMETKRPAGKRPDWVKAPAHLSVNPPVPAPEATPLVPEPAPERLNPVRYGDWEYKGLAIDF